MCRCSHITVLYDKGSKLDITDQYIKNNKIYYFYTDACCCPKRHEFENPDHYRLRPTNIQNEHRRCSFMYDLSASLAHDTIENGHKIPVFNVHGSTKKSSTAAANDLEGGASSTGLAKPSVHAENGTTNIVIATPTKRKLVIHPDETVRTPSTLPPVSLFYRLFCCFGRRKFLRNARVHGEVDIVCGYIYDPSGRMCLGIYDPDHDTFGIDIKPVNPDVICCSCLPDSCLHPYRAEEDDW